MFLRFKPLPSLWFLYFWGIVFVVTTTLVWLLKHERDSDDMDDLGVQDTYKQLIQAMMLPSVQIFMFILLTVKVGFSAADSVTGLKLLEAGVPKDRLALLAIPLVPLQIILPLVISRFTAGPRPMDTYVKAIPYRLLFGLGLTAMVYLTPMMKSSTGEFPFYYYCLLVLVYAIHQVTLYSMFVAGMAMYARVSDPAIGGTYMTLLNTLSNLGGNWPATLALWMVDPLTVKSCVGGVIENTCSTDQLKKECTAGNGTCQTMIDGYYIESVICLIIGLIWLRWGRQKIMYLQSLPESAWKVSRRSAS